MKGPWVKLWRSFLSDPTVQYLMKRYGNGVVTLLVALLTATEDGIVTSPEDELATLCLFEDDEFKKLVDVIIERGIIYRNEKGIISFTNWKKYQESESAERVRRHRNKDNETLHERYSNGNVTEMKRVEVEDRSKKKNKREEASQASRTESRRGEREIPPEAHSLASLLSDLHRAQIDTGYKVTPAQLNAWAKDIEKLNRIDGRDWPDIEAAIRWIKTPGCFWAPNILSGKKLREKYPTIIGQMKRPTGPAPRVLSHGSMLDMGA